MIIIPGAALASAPLQLTSTYEPRPVPPEVSCAHVPEFEPVAVTVAVPEHPADEYSFNVHPDDDDNVVHVSWIEAEAPPEL